MVEKMKHLENLVNFPNSESFESRKVREAKYILPPGGTGCGHSPLFSMICMDKVEAFRHNEKITLAQNQQVDGGISTVSSSTTFSAMYRIAVKNNPLCYSTFVKLACFFIIVLLRKSSLHRCAFTKSLSVNCGHFWELF